MDKTAAFRIDSRQLAQTIYADLVVRSCQLGDKGVAMTVSAENLARLSFKLAQAFQKVEDDLNAENMPKNQGFTVDAASLYAWSK